MTSLLRDDPRPRCTQCRDHQAGDRRSLCQPLQAEDDCGATGRAADLPVEACKAQAGDTIVPDKVLDKNECILAYAFGAIESEDVHMSR